MLKKIVLVLFASSIIILFIFILCASPKTQKMTVVKEAYNLLTYDEKDNEISVIFLINKNNSDMLDKNKIINSYITNDLEDEIMQVKVEEINYLEKVKIKKERFYKYFFKISFKTLLKTDFLLEEAYLKLNYSYGLEAKFNIGSFCYYYENNNYSDISISNLKSTIEDINNKKTITGIALKISNNKESIINIKNIKILDINIDISDIKLIDISNIKVNDDLINITGKEYDLNDDKIEMNDYLLNDELSLFITLKYNKHYEINSFGIMIEYIENNTLKRYYLYPFCFFNNYERLINIEELQFYFSEYE